MTRTNWTHDEIAELFDLSFTELVFRAAEVHRAHHAAGEVQLCTLLSIKTGGCPEDCAYCPQAARYDTGLKAHKLLSLEEVVEKATAAKNAGATRRHGAEAGRRARATPCPAPRSRPPTRPGRYARGGWDRRSLPRSLSAHYPPPFHPTRSTDLAGTPESGGGGA